MTKYTVYAAPAAFMLIITLCLFALCPVYAAQGVSNGSFEICEEGQPPAGWYSESYNRKAHSFSSASGGTDGECCACLTNLLPADSRITQEISCIPGSTYRLSVYARTSGVEITSGSAGASVTVQEPGKNYGDNLVSSMALDDECTQWTELYIYFTTGPETDKVCIWLRLGGYGAESAGTVYFDNVVLEPVNAVPEGEPCAVLGQTSSQTAPGSDISAMHYLPLLAVTVLLIVALVVLLMRKKAALTPEITEPQRHESSSDSDADGDDI